MAREREWAIGLAVIAAALIVAAVTASRYATPLLVGAGLCLVGATFLGLRDVQSGPRLVFLDPETDTRGLVFETNTRGGPNLPRVYPTSHFENGVPLVFAYVRVANKPRVGDRKAKHVWAKVRFYAPSGALLHEMNGRWSDLPQDSGHEKILRAPEMTIPVKRLGSFLDVAFQYDGEEECYGFNDESRFRSSDLRYRPLGSSYPVRVEIEVRGVGCHAAATYKLLAGPVLQKVAG